MKKTITRLLAIVLIATMMFSVVAGCKNDLNNNADSPDYVFVSDALPFPDDLGAIHNIAIINEQIIFSSVSIADNDSRHAADKLLSMNIDGSNPIELISYEPYIEPPVDDENVNSRIAIMSLHADTDNYLWVVETGFFWREYDDANPTTSQSIEDLGSVTNLRKLDVTGAELTATSLNHLPDVGGFTQITSINIDDAGNIYIAVHANESTDVFVLKSDGEFLFKLSTRGWRGELFRMKNGSVALFTQMETGQTLQKIDYVAKSWGASVGIPVNAQKVFSDSKEFDVLYSDNSSLYGFISETSESESLLSISDSNVGSDGVDFASILSDGRVLLATQARGKASPDFFVLTRTQASDMPERTVLTLAGWGFESPLRSAIEEFNRTNISYRIEATDYLELGIGDDWSAGILRLNTEIISGRVPDIIRGFNLPLTLYAKKGLLVDLYPFIDADPDFTRDSFVENVFRAIEIDGGLYEISPAFNVSTVIGHPQVVGESIGWNMDEFRAVLNANPQADIPFGEGYTAMSFINMYLYYNIDEHVDQSAGTVNFESDDFIRILEFAKTLPVDFVWESDINKHPQYAIPSGRQLMILTSLAPLHQFQENVSYFDGDFVFKGLPNIDRNGHSLNVSHFSLSMTTTGSNQEGVWEFMRMVLDKDWQLTNIERDFPTNKAAFNEISMKAMTRWSYPVTQDSLDRIVELIGSVSNVFSVDVRLMDIVREGANDFFNGRNSAREAARIIQSRASIYMAEQG
jgi:ABC-type glycerol-3-phosphate transport system substrate-binding protein